MKKYLPCLMVCLCIGFAVGASAGDADTIYIKYPKDQHFFIPQQHPYHQTLTLKLFLSQAFYDG
jgi:hypothetical protein